MLPDSVLDRLARATRVVALTGAGISAESGVPTFRDAQTGLWAQYRPEDLATAEAFLARPRLLWDWYAWRRELTARAEPNAGHAALVRFEQLFPAFTLVTQNVDSLHARAGSRDVLELHGNIARVKCFDEGTLYSAVDVTDDGKTSPRCPSCGALLRPDIVWFGEMLPLAQLERAEAAAQSAEVLLSIGTSGLVHPAAGLPLLAKRAGALVLELNPSRTPLTPEVDLHLAGPAGELLPMLVQQIEAKRS